MKFKTMKNLKGILHVFCKHYCKPHNLLHLKKYPQNYLGDVKDLQVSTDELLFSKHQLKLMIVKQLQQKLKSLNQDIVFPFLENNSEQSVDEYIDFLLQHLEKQGMNDLKDTVQKNLQCHHLTDCLLGYR